MVSFKKTFAAVVLLSAVAAFPTEISSSLDRRTGGGGSYVTSQQDSSQEYTSVTINVVTTRWTELNSLIVGCQNDFTSGQVSATIAQQNIEAIAAQFQQAMLTFDAMDEIEIGETLKGMIKQTFQNFASLIISYQKSFGSQVSDLFKPIFSKIDDQFSQFFKKCHAVGISIKDMISSAGAGLIALIGLDSFMLQINIIKT